MSLLRVLSTLPSVAVVLAACAPAEPRAPVAPGAAPATASAPVEPARLVVTADDGFQLTMWRKAPPTDSGS